jgi:hypothetical protein
MTVIVSDLGVKYLSAASTPTSSPTLLYTTPSAYLVEVTATNLAITDGVIYIFVKHSGDTASTQWAHIVYNLPIPSQNSYTTAKIAVNQGDSVYVAGSTDISFHGQGMAQIA